MSAPTQSGGPIKPLIYWIVWAAVLSGLVLIYVFLAPKAAKTAGTGELAKNLAAIVPLFVSIVIRWLALPRFDDLTRMFPLYIVGLALAEGSGILGLFLGGPYYQDLYALGVLGVIQYAPLFPQRSRSGRRDFIPNN